MSPFLAKAFGFDNSKHKVRTEIVAGLTTFLTMAYILAVNPSIFGALEGQGMPTNAVFTATALAALVPSALAFLLVRCRFFGFEIRNHRDFPLGQPYDCVLCADTEQSLALFLYNLRFDLVDRQSHFVETVEDRLVDVAAGEFHTPHFFTTSKVSCCIFLKTVAFRIRVIASEITLLKIQ